MPEILRGLFYLIVVIIIGLFVSFRDEINDLWKDVFGKRIDSTPEKDQFEFRSWWHDELSEEERESYLKIVKNPLGANADRQNTGGADLETLNPD